MFDYPKWLVHLKLLNYQQNLSYLPYLAHQTAFDYQKLANYLTR
ncbi:hypothetical protein HPSMNH_0056 [Glaesserella parasuis MN-H]|nr:hypothetical protein HPSMNH_0056 [Glaesserella parasuis MN-H]